MNEIDRLSALRRLEKFEFGKPVRIDAGTDVLGALLALDGFIFANDRLGPVSRRTMNVGNDLFRVTESNTEYEITAMRKGGRSIVTHYEERDVNSYSDDDREFENQDPARDHYEGDYACVSCSWEGNRVKFGLSCPNCGSACTRTGTR